VRRPPLRVLGALGVVISLALLAACSGNDRTSGEGGFIGSASRVTVVPPDQRRPVATITGPRLGGTGSVSSTDFAGRVLVVNVWGSWCPPCRQEAPDLQAASQATRSKAAFLGITTKDADPANAEAFVRAFKITYPSIYDPDGTALLAFDRELPPSAIPSTLVIDAHGRLAVRVLGTISRQSLVDIVDDIAAGR
jgi:thiol-disulfide isomerase/thioredoxin